MEQPTKAEDLVDDTAPWTKNTFLPAVALLVVLAMMVSLAVMAASRFCSLPMAGLPLPPAGEDDRMLCVVCLERERQVGLKTKHKLLSCLAFSEYLLNTSAVSY